MNKNIRSDILIGVAAMGASSLVSALFGVVARYLHQDFGDYHQLWIRLLLMSLLGMCLPAGHGTFQAVLSLPKKKILQMGLHAFLIYPLGAVTWVAAVQISPLATVAFIVALPLEALWGAIFFGDRFGSRTIMFSLLAIGGLWLLVSPEQNGIGTGEILAIISSISFSLGLMLSVRRGSGLSMFHSNIFMGLLGAVMIAAPGFWNEALPTNVDLTSVVVLFVGAAMVLLNLNLLSIGFKRLSGALAGSVLMLEALFSSLLGYFWFGEILTPSALYGGLLILSSAIGLTLSEHRGKTRQVET